MARYSSQSSISVTCWRLYSKWIAAQSGWVIIAATPEGGGKSSASISASVSASSRGQVSPARAARGTWSPTVVRPSPRLSDISLNVRPLARSLRASLIFRIGNLFMGSSSVKERETNPLRDHSTAVASGQIVLSGCPRILVRMRLEWLSG